jgi:hypothetical protein
MVPDPVGIPPFLRIDLDALELHAEVDVVTSGQSRLAALTHDLSAFHHLTLMHRDLAEVAIDRLKPVPMIQHDAVAVDPQRGRVHHPAVVGRHNPHMLSHGEIVAKMDLLIDLLSLVKIVPNVSEVRLHGRVGLLQEGLLRESAA